jgi:hypothetical protein
MGEGGKPVVDDLEVVLNGSVGIPNVEWFRRRVSAKDILCFGESEEAETYGIEKTLRSVTLSSDCMELVD